MSQVVLQRIVKYTNPRVVCKGKFLLGNRDWNCKKFHGLLGHFDPDGQFLNAISLSAGHAVTLCILSGSSVGQSGQMTTAGPVLQ